MPVPDRLLGVRPPEVCLPSAARWAAVVPDGALPLRDPVCRDLAALGARGVDRDDAVVQVAKIPRLSQ
jgi:hypothetical protein